MTVQVLAVKGPAQDVVWDKDKARVKVEWVDRLLEDQAEIAYARVVEQRSLMLSDSLAMQRAVLNVVQK